MEKRNDGNTTGTIVIKVENEKKETGNQFYLISAVLKFAQVQPVPKLKKD